MAKPFLIVWSISCVLLLVLTLMTTRQTLKLREAESALRQDMERIEARRRLLEQELQVRSRLDVLSSIVAKQKGQGNDTLVLHPPKMDQILSLDDFKTRIEDLPKSSVSKPVRKNKAIDESHWLSTDLPRTRFPSLH